jgi:hypothetical protein
MGAIDPGSNGCGNFKELASGNRQCVFNVRDQFSIAEICSLQSTGWETSLRHKVNIVRCLGTNRASSILLFRAAARRFSPATQRNKARELVEIALQHH